MTEQEIDLLLGRDAPLSLIHVTSSRCRLCAIAHREFTAFAELIQDQVAVYEIEADLQPGVLARLNIKAVPALLIYASGIEIGALLGFYSKDELHRRLWSLILDRE